MATFSKRVAFAAVLVFASASASAATVGYYGCTSSNAERAQAIEDAGHQAVPVTTFSTSTLAPLDTLVYEECSSWGYRADAAIDEAVANGMTLIVHDWMFERDAARALPGRPVPAFTWNPGMNDVEVPQQSPIRVGPFGTLTSTSLDGGTASYHGHFAAASLPAGSTVLLTTASAQQVVAFSYRTGAGRVVFASIPLSYYLGGNGPAQVRAGMGIYLRNLLAWDGADVFTSCAAEGFTGAKLTLCRKVCESSASGTTLAGLIRVYQAAYRQDPPCGR